MHKNFIKPKYRGVIHMIAFIMTVVASLVYFILFKQSLPVFIYLMVQLIQFGVSGFYHVINWSNKYRNIFQLLDHIAIFFMISGTQTSVLLSLKHNFQPILSTWIVSSLGILKILILKKVHDFMEIYLYVITGLIITPFLRTDSLDIIEFILLLFGAAFYLIGALILGFEKPNPSPKIFGFHEIFHIFTILGNMSFGSIIFKKYFKY